MNIESRNALHTEIARGHIAGRTSGHIAATVRSARSEMRSAEQDWRRTEFDDTGWNDRIENVPHPHGRLITVLLWVMWPAAVMAITYWWIA